MGRHHVCRICGSYSKGEPECNCSLNETQILIKMKVGATIIETFYDDSDYPFVYLIEHLSYSGGGAIFMKTYIGSAGDDYEPDQKITRISEEDFAAIKEKCLTRDAADQVPVEDDESEEQVEQEETGACDKLFTFAMLERDGKMRRGFFGEIRPGEEKKVERYFPESDLPKEKEKLIRSGWTVTWDGIWEKNNKNHKKAVKAEKQRLNSRSPTPELLDKSTNSICGYKIGPTPCTYRQPSAVVCTKTQSPGLCSTHAKVGSHSTM